MGKPNKKREAFEHYVRRHFSGWKKWKLLERQAEGYSDLIIQDEWKVWKRSWKAAMKVRGEMA